MDNVERLTKKPNDPLFVPENDFLKLPHTKNHFLELIKCSMKSLLSSYQKVVAGEFLL